MAELKYFLLGLSLLKALAGGYIGAQLGEGIIGVYIDTDQIIYDIKEILSWN